MASELWTLPDVGAEDAVTVIEVHVSNGDQVSEGDLLVVLESDKASMEIEAPGDGTIDQLKVQINDQIKNGDPVMDWTPAEGSSPAPAETTAPEPEATPSAPEPTAPPPAPASGPTTWNLPDVGAEEAVTVIEVHVKDGDKLTEGDLIIVLESDKASMEIEAPGDGELLSLKVKEGDSIKNGEPVMEWVPAEATAPAPTPAPAASTPPSAPKAAQQPAPAPAAPATSNQSPAININGDKVHAGPAVRRLAREFGVDMLQVKGTGPKGRILKEDIQNYVKSRLQEAPAAVTGGSGIPPVAEIDFSKFGEVETLALPRLKQIAAENFQKSWLNLPHVTQHDECDITQLEAFRKSVKDEAAHKSIKLTPLAFIMKACAKAIEEMPVFASSLSPDGKSLIMKKYIHIGMAVDTPDGLLVPVIKDVDKKCVYELAQDIVLMAGKAQKKQLKPAEMQGGVFTISSLGAIGGTAFTPIVNAPEVAILGVSKSETKPVWDGEQFQPKLMLPLSLSYDHRVINGADAARFTVMVGQFLSDIRRLVL